MRARRQRRQQEYAFLESPQFDLSQRGTALAQTSDHFCTVSGRRHLRSPGIEFTAGEESADDVDVGASANSSKNRRIISLMIPMELSMRGATGFVARALCISVPKSPGVQSSLTAPACLRFASA